MFLKKLACTPKREKKWSLIRKNDNEIDRINN